jgi:hypothetical protein
MTEEEIAIRIPDDFRSDKAIQHGNYKVGLCAIPFAFVQDSIHLIAEEGEMEHFKMDEKGLGGR